MYDLLNNALFIIYHDIFFSFDTNSAPYYIDNLFAIINNKMSCLYKIFRSDIIFISIKGGSSEHEVDNWSEHNSMATDILVFHTYKSKEIIQFIRKLIYKLTKVHISFYDTYLQTLIFASSVLPYVISFIIFFFPFFSSLMNDGQQTSWKWELTS